MCLVVFPMQFSNVFNLSSGTARVIRGDAGNENLNVAGIQRFFRCNQNDSMAGERSFLFGKSTSNQVNDTYFEERENIKCIQYCSLVFRF